MKKQRRQVYREDLWVLYTEAESCLKKASYDKRRTDCLRAAMVEIRGALRNVCFEDAKEFGDPSIVEEFEKVDAPPVADGAPR